ncbi:CBS domain-containing protein [Oceanithermus sp.]|uniref:CBS domain-containing protein n=1 Tax=Oceanithermus sp. TaxID=2268145 RepID=UPI0025DAD1C2|nr:CBS domain-containing protein [Oceanithermus sp.]
MRTVRELRWAGAIAYLAALAVGLLAAFLTHLLFRGQGRFGWEGFNTVGVAEGLVFVLVFTFSLWAAKRAVRVPCTTLLTAGLVAPPSAGKVARSLPTIEQVESFEGRLAVLTEGGEPLGVLGLEDHMVPWEQAPVVPADVAVSELSSLFWKNPVVFVVDDGHVVGVITRERFFQLMGFGRLA